MDETLCMELTRDGDPELFYDGIEGFSYEWCHSHRLRIHEEPVLNPPADGSSIRFILDEVIESVPVSDHEMTLTVFDEWASAEEDGDLGFGLSCDKDEAVCADLLNALDDGAVDRVEATFRCEEGAPRLLSFTEPAAEE